MALVLSLLSPTTILIGFIICFIVIHIVRSRKSRLEFSKLPQPSGKLPVLGHSLLLSKKGVDITESSFEAFYKYAVEFHEYGLYAFDLAFQPSVHIFDPEHFEKLMTSTTHINKSTTYFPLLRWLGTGGEKWHKDSKTLTPAFDFKIIEKFNPLFNRHARILCDNIKATLNMEIDNCVSTVSACALDTICETSMGVDMKTQTSGENNFSKSFVEFNRLSTKRTLNTLLNKSDLLYAMTPNGQKAKRMIQNMHAFTGSIARQRKKEMESTTTSEFDNSQEKRKSMSLLDLMLDIHLNDNNFSVQDIQLQLDNILFAGHDTVSNAIALVFMCLANYTDVQHRARAEIIDVIGDKESEICSKHLSKFPYLEMVINETLRIYPPIPFTGRHLYENFTFGDHIIPKGTEIWLNYFALHRNLTHWPEPDTFDPERFSVENSTDRHPFAFVPFSAGQRKCIGQRYAKSFMKIVIARIVTQFEIVPITKIDDLKLSYEITIKTMKPIRLKFKSIKG